jgi:hypothetical protein
MGLMLENNPKKMAPVFTRDKRESVCAEITPNHEDKARRRFN